MLSLSNSHIWFVSGLVLSSFDAWQEGVKRGQQGVKRGTSDPAARLWNFTGECYVWGERWEAHPRRNALSVWYHCDGNLKLQEGQWNGNAEERPFSHCLPGFCQDKMSEFLPCLCFSRKPNPLSGVKVRNPAAARWQTRIPAVTWDAYSGNKLSQQKWQEQETWCNGKTDENHVLHPRVSYLLGQGAQEQWLHVFLQLFATTWTQMVSEGKKKSFLHFDELEQYDFNNTGRNVLQQQSKTPDRGGFLAQGFVRQNNALPHCKTKFFWTKKSAYFLIESS